MTFRLLVIGASIIVGLLGSRHFRSWLNPVTALTAPLAVALAVQAIMLPDANFGGRAALTFIAAELAFLLGASLVGQRGVRRTRLYARAGKGDAIRFIGWVAGVGTLAGAFVLNRWFSSADAAYVGRDRFNRELAVDALAGGQTWALRILIASLIFSAVWALLSWRASVPGSTALVALSLTSAVAFALAVRARFTTLIVLLLVGLIVLLFERTEKSTVSAPNPKRGLWALVRVGALALLLASMAFVVFRTVGIERYGGSSPEGGFARSFAIAAAGGPSAFSEYLDDPEAVQLTGGGLSFGISVAGWFDIIGVQARELGQASSVRIVDDDVDSKTNVYGALFFLMHDVGWTGAMFVMGGLGLLMSSVERRHYNLPTPRTALVRLLLYLLATAVPSMLLSYYNFWWGLLGLSSVIGVWFIAEPTNVRQHDEPIGRTRNRS